jgi:hypothetical protein
MRIYLSGVALIGVLLSGCGGGGDGGEVSKPANRGGVESAIGREAPRGEPAAAEPVDPQTTPAGPSAVELVLQR